MSDFIRQWSVEETHFGTSKSWVVLSSLEASIKARIERLGIPLKNWNIQINYGIKTGYNEAFIVDSETKARLINLDSKNAEIIRPILKGRNIKKYKAEFGNLWIINSHNGLKKKLIPRVNVEQDYPVVYQYLKNYEQELIRRFDKGDHWTNLRNCAYLDEFEREKIIWLELTDIPKFAYDNRQIMVEATAFMMVGEKLKYLTAFLNSKISEWYFDKITTSSGVGTNRWKKIYIENLPVPIISGEPLNKIEVLIDRILKRIEDLQTTVELEEEIDDLLCDYYGFSKEERAVIYNR